MRLHQGISRPHLSEAVPITARLGVLSASTGCYLDDLFVDPAHRGSGVADVLLIELRRTARTNEWSVIRWITAHDNARAIATYNRHATRTDWLTYDMPPANP